MLGKAYTYFEMNAKALYGFEQLKNGRPDVFGALKNMGLETNTDVGRVFYSVYFAKATGGTSDLNQEIDDAMAKIIKRFGQSLP